MDTSLVMDVLNEALSIYGKPEIFNTDQGSQYTSNIHTQTLIDNGITISMDGKGRATDNSVPRKLITTDNTGGLSYSYAA
jgi:putative transposase